MAEPTHQAAQSQHPHPHHHHHAPRRPLWQRVVMITLAIIVAVVIPMIIAVVVVGSDAAYATVMGVIAALSGAFRSGWMRGVRVIPFIAVLGVAAALVGYGWAWVVVMGIVGLAAGIGVPFGYMPALLAAGLVPTLVHAPTDVWRAVLVGCFAAAGGLIGVAFAHRLGAKRAPKPPDRRPGLGVLTGVVGLILMGGGSAIAIGLNMPHGYWIPLTIIAVVPAMAMGDTHRGRQRLAGTVGALVIVIPISFIPMPVWLFYLLGLALFVPALVVFKRNYGYYAFLESAAVVMLVSAGHGDVLEAGADRALAAIIAVGMVFAAALIIPQVLKRLPVASAPAELLDP